MPKYLSFFLISLLLVILSLASIQLWEPADTVYQVQFTADERQWLKDNPIIKVAIDPDFAPYEFYQGDEAQGIGLDYLEYMTYQYGLEFEVTHLESWTDSLNAIKNQEADIITALVESPQRAEFMLFTPSYTAIQNVVLVGDGTPSDFDASVLTTMQVAVIKDYFAQDLLELHYPGIDLYEATDISDGLRALSFGQVDAFVVDSAQAAYYIPKIGVNNLKMNENIDLGFDLPLRFGVRKNASELRNVLSKIIKGIPEDVHEQIQQNWKTNAFEPGVDTQLFIIISVLISTVLLSGALMILWNVTLNQQIDEKTKNIRKEIDKRKIVENQLRELINAIPYPVSVKDASGLYVYANRAYSDLIHIPLAKIVGHQDLALYDLSPNVNRMIMSDGDETVIDLKQAYRINALEILGQEGRRVYDVTKRPIYIDDKGSLGILSFSVDITEQHDSQEDLQVLNEHLEEIVDQRVLEYKEKNQKLLEAFETLQRSQQNLTDLNKELSTSLDVLERTQDKLIEVEKFAALGRSASAVAHEMNTPIGIGISAVTYGYEEMKKLFGKIRTDSITFVEITESLEKVVESLELVNSSIVKMLETTRALDKLTSTQWKNQQDAFVLCTLIHEQFENTKKKIGSVSGLESIDLGVHCDPTLKIHTSREACQFIFDNLFQNSILHGFTSVDSMKNIKISCTFSNDLVNVHYEDNGQGVSQDTLSKIIEPLYTSRRGTGHLGLGLSIVYNIIVQNLEGHMTIYNLDSGGLAIDFSIQTTHSPVPLDE